MREFQRTKRLRSLPAIALCTCVLFVGDTQASGPGPLGKTLQGKVAEHFFDKMMGMPEPFTVGELSRVLHSQGLVRELHLLSLVGHSKGQDFGADIRSLFPELPSEYVENTPYHYYFADDSGDDFFQQLLLNVVVFEKSRWVAVLTDNESFFFSQLQSFDLALNDEWHSVDNAQRLELSQKLRVPMLSPLSARIFLREGRWVDGAIAFIEDWTILRAYDTEGDLFLAVQYGVKASAREELGLDSIYGIIAIKAS